MNHSQVIDIIEISTKIEIIDSLNGKNEIILALEDKKAITELEKIFDNLKSINGYWMSRGEYSLFFFQGQSQILEIEYFFPCHLRCKHWNSDMLILDKKGIIDWFASLGIDLIERSKMKVDIEFLLKDGVINEAQYQNYLKKQNEKPS
ncbi:hypothetical protein [Bernardetia sp.]|uniref:hypothetical protein n=1 Tax=Bernardetia sp. TaxID=1937974 RepID=UPI0025C54C31|nr:hypothetical protein [Bernardetia sp.]